MGLKALEFGRSRRDVRYGKEAKQAQRFAAGIDGHVLLAGWNEQYIARAGGIDTALCVHRALARQYIDAFLEVVMQMRTARRVARLCRRDLGNTETDPRADRAGHRLERYAPRQIQSFCVRLLQEPGHRIVFLRSLDAIA